MTFVEKAKEFDTVEKAYPRIDKWGRREWQLYDKDALLKFRKWIKKKFGSRFEVFFDRRLGLATIDELRGKGSEGKMTYLVLRNPWTREAEILPSEHKREFLSVYTKFKDKEDRISTEELDKAFQY